MIVPRPPGGTARAQRDLHNGDMMIGQTILHHKIIERLGEGSMGVVSNARDLSLDRLGDREKQVETLQATLRMHPRIILQHPDNAWAHMFYAIDLVQSGRTRSGEIARIESPGYRLPS